MGNAIKYGKIEFMIIATFNILMAILIGFVTSFIIPLVYIILYYAIYKGHDKIRWILAVINLITAFIYSSLPIYKMEFAEYMINIVIPLILMISTILVFLGKTKHFIKYKLQVRYDNKDKY